MAGYPIRLTLTAEQLDKMNTSQVRDLTRMLATNRRLLDQRGVYVQELRKQLDELQESHDLLHDSIHNANRGTYRRDERIRKLEEFISYLLKVLTNRRAGGEDWTLTSGLLHYFWRYCTNSPLFLATQHDRGKGKDKAILIERVRDDYNAFAIRIVDAMNRQEVGRKLRELMDAEDPNVRELLDQMGEVEG